MITKQTIESFFESGQSTKKDTYITDISKRVRVHSEGLYPEKLIDTSRPNEPDVIKQYRKDVYKSYTEGYFNKILVLLQKIAKSEDWSIEYKKSEGAVAETETIEKYLKDDFPYFDSLENYAFSILLKDLLVDPNAIILVLPLSLEVKENEYYKPFPSVYSCENVLYFDADLLVVRTSEIGSIETYKFIDNDSIFIVTKDKTQAGESNISFLEYKNIVGEIPAFKLGGLIKKTIEKNNGLEFVYDSFITPCLNSFDEAGRCYSDHQANLVQNIHPEKYIYQIGECKTCAGNGRIRHGNLGTEDYEVSNCKDCKGSGSKSSPFGIHEINIENIPGGGVSVPAPPIGYVSKPIELIHALKTEIEEQCRAGLSALGVEYLHESPLNQSGLAKEYDKQEVDTFVSSVARHFVLNIIKPIIWYTSKWRYTLSLPIKTIESNNPTVKVPKRFNTLTSAIIGERLRSAITNNYSFIIRNALELQYIKSEFGEDSDQLNLAKTVFQIDPLVGKTEDEKMTMLANGGVSKLDYIVSCNLKKYVTLAQDATKNFFDLDYKKKIEVIYKYAGETLNELPSPIPLQ